MRRVVTGVLVVVISAGVLIAVQAGGQKADSQATVGVKAFGEAAKGCPMTAAKADCPKETEGVCCMVKEGCCPKAEKTPGCPKAAKAACCEACPLKDDCPKAGEPGCCEVCPLNKGECPKAKACEVKSAGCPMAGAAASAGACGMYAGSGCGGLAPTGE